MVTFFEPFFGTKAPPGRRAMPSVETGFAGTAADGAGSVGTTTEGMITVCAAAALDAAGAFGSCTTSAGFCAQPTTPAKATTSAVRRTSPVIITRKMRPGCVERQVDAALDALRPSPDARQAARPPGIGCGACFTLISLDGAGPDIAGDSAAGVREHRTMPLRIDSKRRRVDVPPSANEAPFVLVRATANAAPSVGDAARKAVEAPTRLAADALTRADTERPGLLGKLARDLGLPAVTTHTLSAKLEKVGDTLQVGDSKFFPVYAKGISARIGLLNYIKVRGLSWKVSARKEKEGLRIWRIK